MLKRKMQDGTIIQLDHAVADAVRGRMLSDDEGFFFQRELEYVKARSYDVQYADLIARDLFPVSNEAGPGVDTITYTTYDQAGAAKIINAYAKDLPRVDVKGKETTIPVRSVGISYGYSLDEIQSAARAGRPLDQRRANAATRSVEQLINDIAFNGDSESGLQGFLTHPNIPAGNVSQGASGETEWDGKTPDEILFDINDLFADIFETTKMKERGNTLLLPVRQWSYIMSTPRATSSDTTIAQFVAQNSPYLTSVEDIIPVNELMGVGTAGADIMVAYDRNPEKLQLEIPVELEMLAAQMRGLEFIVPGRSRLGGINYYYPLSAAIGEGI